MKFTSEALFFKHCMDYVGTSGVEVQITTVDTEDIQEDGTVWLKRRRNGGVLRVLGVPILAFQTGKS